MDERREIPPPSDQYSDAQDRIRFALSNEHFHDKPDEEAAMLYFDTVDDLLLNPGNFRYHSRVRHDAYGGFPVEDVNLELPGVLPDGSVLDLSYDFMIPHDGEMKVVGGTFVLRTDGDNNTQRSMVIYMPMDFGLRKIITLHTPLLDESLSESRWQSQLSDSLAETMDPELVRSLETLLSREAVMLRAHDFAYDDPEIEQARTMFEFYRIRSDMMRKTYEGDHLKKVSGVRTSGYVGKEEIQELTALIRLAGSI